MMIRIGTPIALPSWQPWAGLIGVFVFTVLSVWLAGRIFRVAILMQGRPPKLGDLLRWALREGVKRGLPIVFSVHDEIVVETHRSQADADEAILHDIMNNVPAWAEGLPVKAEVDRMERYGK